MGTDIAIGALLFEHPLLAGAGICKTLADVVEAARSAVAGMEIGSITREPRAGNEGDNFYHESKRGVLLYTVNSLGMPNAGAAEVEKFSHEAIEAAHENGKRIGINVAADSAEELAEMVLWAAQLGYDWVTVNAACPNKFIEGKPASILYYDSIETAKALALLKDRTRQVDCPVWWKLSPDNDTLGYQIRMLDLLSHCDIISGLVVNNTVPHTLSLDMQGKPNIDMPYGGLGGPAVKPKALADIRRIRERYGKRFTLMGAGGVTDGQDVKDYLNAGADSVQATSVYWANNMDFHIFSEILSDYVL